MMWWLCAKVSETSDTITYRYSTESEKLDGLITHSKAAGKSALSAPSSKDRKTPWKADLTMSRFDRWIVYKGFPEHRMVVVG